MQPQLNLITKTYDFELKETAFCEEKEVDLPTIEEIREAENKYGKNLINVKQINEIGIDSIDKLNENYNKKVTFSKEDNNKKLKNSINNI